MADEDDTSNTLINASYITSQLCNSNLVGVAIQALSKYLKFPLSLNNSKMALTLLQKFLLDAHLYMNKMYIQNQKKIDAYYHNSNDTNSNSNSSGGSSHKDKDKIYIFQNIKLYNESLAAALNTLKN